MYNIYFFILAPVAVGKEPDGLKRESDKSEDSGRKKFKPEEPSHDKVVSALLTHQLF